MGRLEGGQALGDTQQQALELVKLIEAEFGVELTPGNIDKRLKELKIKLYERG